jgi:hypothetical protein
MGRRRKYDPVIVIADILQRGLNADKALLAQDRGQMSECCRDRLPCLAR